MENLPIGKDSNPEWMFHYKNIYIFTLKFAWKLNYSLLPNFNKQSAKCYQGNKFKYVRIVVPLVQDTLDSFINQKLDEIQSTTLEIKDSTDSK